MLIAFKTFIVSLLCLSSVSALADSRPFQTADLKSQILSLAEAYQGQSDPDGSLQKNLEVLVDELVENNPMPSAKDRLSLISGGWKQVWGPYDYRNDDGGIDPTLGIFEIYQVVFAAGYYYNVAPFYPNADKNKEQIGLLRGEFELDLINPNVLNVRFTDYPGVDPRPQDVNIWELAAQAEAGQLSNAITIVPSPIVKQFFKGGSLEEVYTDQDLRILYGQKLPPSTRRFLYVMTRVQ